MNESSSFFSLSALTLACAMAVSGMTHAAQTQDQKVHQLQAVQIEENADENGRAVITADKLEIQPNSTGTVTDALRGVSSIQFDANSRDGAAGAEITAPEISIRGSRSYENAYSINGINNNNAFYDDSDAVAPGSKYNGDVQSIVLNTDLLENITVLTENISAEYGDFTGGVVDAKMRDAQTDRWHISAWTRHTRDAWSKQHLTEAQQNENHPAFDSGLQKEFKKTTAGVTLEGPLMDGKLGAMVSYQKTHSSTSTWSAYTSSKNNYFYEKKDSTRDLDNFVLRLNTDPANDFYVATTLMYSPYEAEYEPKTYRNASFEHQGGGLTFLINTRANLSIGTWTNDLGMSRTHADRKSGSDTEWMWKFDPNSANWGSNSGASLASEGGQGDLEQTQDAVNFKSMLVLNPMMLGNTEHKIRVGGDVQYKRVESDFSGRTTFTGSFLAPGVQGDKADGVWADHQFATMRWHFLAEETEESFVSANLFAEDSIRIERFTVRPGVRVSYDDVTNQVNVAPRFMADADILDDGRYKLNFGYNRYYGSELLGLATRFNPTKVTQKRDRKPGADGKPSAWGPEVVDPSRNAFNLGDLDTPYSDEFVLGATAHVYDTVFQLQGVYRKYEDQLFYKTTKNIVANKVYTDSFLTNDGESEYKGITFNLVKSYDLGVWGRHTSSLGVTWSELESNSVNFNNLYTGQDTLDLDAIYLDGEKINAEDLPADNFNSRWVVTYNHDMSFMDDRLRSGVLVRWEEAADGIYRLGKNDEGYVAGQTDFVSYENDDLFTVDMTVAYDLIQTANSTLTVNMDIMNLFDNKMILDATGKGNYAMGRQFFLGLSYKY